MLLIKGADYLIDGSTSIARRFGISSLVIGLTVVAFGTSAPELAVSVLSAISGSTDLALGNINGSNIANILLILGIVGVLTGAAVESRTVIKEIPFMALAGAALTITTIDVFIGGTGQAMISRGDGLLLLCFFLIFMYYMILSAKDAPMAAVEKPKYKIGFAVIYTLMGLAGLVVGGKLAVDGASGIALALGVSQSLIGLTVVALGTSLPEIVSSVVAARKGKTDLAVGNVVGSNIFNILLVLGLTATVQPIPVSNRGIEDAIFALAVMLIFFLALFVNKVGRGGSAKGIDRGTGILFLILYAVYIVYIAIRG